MSKKSNPEEGVGSFVDLAEVMGKEAEEEAKKLASKAVDPNAPFFKKLDAILEAINGIAHQLCRIADHLTGPVKLPDGESDSESLAGEPDDGEVPKGIDLVMSLFPEDLRSKLKFSLENGKVKVAPKQYLGSENFAKMASIVREAGGEYKSAGKNSHFLVPPMKAESTPSQTGSPVDAIKAKFPPVQADMLTFELGDGKVIIKAKQYLGSDNFAKIAQTVRAIGGEYISDKKNSRFEVPIK